MALGSASVAKVAKRRPKSADFFCFVPSFNAWLCLIFGGKQGRSCSAAWGRGYIGASRLSICNFTKQSSISSPLTLLLPLSACRSLLTNRPALSCASLPCRSSHRRDKSQSITQYTEKVIYQFAVLAFCRAASLLACNPAAPIILAIIISNSLFGPEYGRVNCVVSAREQRA
jgi:hypothetical protein